MSKFSDAQDSYIFSFVTKFLFIIVDYMRCFVF